MSRDTQLLQEIGKADKSRSLQGLLKCGFPFFNIRKDSIGIAKNKFICIHKITYIFSHCLI